MYRDWDPDLLRLSGAALRGPSPAAGLRRPGSNKNTGRVAEPSLGGGGVCVRTRLRISNPAPQMFDRVRDANAS